ncbi:cytochrome P450 [Xylariomycetidae sp. FL2044]|nr:cytochrome P450 [Xylariomycetidae sp. FL2044]
MNLVKELTAYAALALVTYQAFLYAYRLSLHPLRQYPGPLFAKVSDLYVGFFAACQTSHLMTYENHLKYGSVVRLGPNRLVFNSVTALRDIYMSERVTKSIIYRAGQPRPDLPSVMTVRDKALHRSKRRVFGAAISDQSMRLFEPTMIEQVDVFLQKLLKAAQSSSAVNITHNSRYLTVDVVGHLGFGYPLNTQTNPTNRFLIRAFDLTSIRIALCMQYPLLYHLKTDLLVSLSRSSLRLPLLALLETMVKQRLSQPKDAKHDLLSFISSSGSSEEDVRATNLWAEAAFFFPAGGETIASALNATFFYLSRNSHCYKTLALEIRSTFESGLDIQGGPRLSSCRYLRACIDEAMRMSPPVPGTLWRELYDEEKPKQPLIIDGHVIPPNTAFGINTYSIHHNEEYFPDPFTFKPERWLASEASGSASEGDPEARKIMHDAFFSFAAGPRVCAGMSMAYLESSLVIAKTMWYFDFDRVPGSLGTTGGGTPGKPGGRGRVNEYQLRDVFAAAHDGPNLVFRTRGDFYREIS